jgi:hypothetical protein
MPFTCGDVWHDGAVVRLRADLPTERRSDGLGDLDFACSARLPPCAICLLRAVSRVTSLPPLRLAGLFRQLPSWCSLLPGTGS